METIGIYRPGFMALGLREARFHGVGFEVVVHAASLTSTLRV